MYGLDTHENVSVLLVEDDIIDVEAVRREFKKQNMQNPFYHAASGVQALELLRGSGQKPAIDPPVLMLIDLNMPIMGGLEFLNEVRGDEHLKKNVAFILTTSARQSDVEAAYEMNAAGYFLKDNIQDLVNIISLYKKINKFSQA